MNKIVFQLLRGALIHKRNNLGSAKINTINRVNFTTIKGDENPNQIPEEVKKMMQNQKIKKKPQQMPILKDISELNRIQQLTQIFKKMVFMTKQQRQIALRYLLSAIYQQKVPVESLNLKAFEVALKQFPHLKLETQIFQINYLVHQIQQIYRHKQNPDQSNEQSDQNKTKSLQLFNQINDKYYHSFNVTLKGVPPQHLTRSKATIYKHFAQYNFEYLFNPKITDKNSSLFDQNLSILKKSRQFLAESLNCHKQVLLSEHKKLQSDEIKALKEEDAERHQIRLSAIKQNIRKLVESIGECLYAIFKVINKEHRLLKDPIQHRNRKIELLSLIDCYIPFYSVIPGIKQLSMMYYKLYKIKIEAKFTAVGEPKTQEELKAKVKQAVEDYNRLYLQCLECLDESIRVDKFESIKQISTTIISTKYMIGRTVKKTQTQIKNSLASQAKSIIDKMKKQYKQPVQFYLMQIIKEMLNIKA